MKLISSNVKDINKYFHNTYIKVKEFGDTLFLINSVDHYGVKGDREDGQPFIIYLDDEHPYELDYVLPRKSFFQHGPNAIQLCRVPAQQYQRGMNSQNTALSYLSASGEKRNGSLNFETLRSYVNKQMFSTLKQAVADKERTSSALSPRMMYHKSKKQIFMDFEPIAHVSVSKAGNLVVKMTNVVFKPEVEKMLNNPDDKGVSLL